MQTAAYEALNGAKGTIGVYNYQTGEILCMVSSPSFDPADPPEIRDGDTQYDGVYLNRFLSSAFTPGSVFKVVTAAAALEKLEGVASRTFHCSGSVTIGGDTITCPYVHGDMDFYGAMANSCNCVFAQLAVELGGSTLSSYAQQAGLLDGGSVSGIDTAAGTYVISENDSEVGWSGVGQYEDLANPCALMTMMGAIAGRGSAREPYLLGKVTSMTGTAARSTGTSGTMHLWNADTCQALADMLRNNVTETYGQSRFGDLPVCAKSGTAEVGQGKAPHSWFAGFVDSDDLPLAFVALVENGGGGSAVAGSAAAQVLRTAAELL